jgi:hypothetical protein
MDKDTTRVEVLSAHFYDRDRQPGDRYDCANQYLPILVTLGRVRVVDQRQEAVEPLIFNQATDLATMPIPLKRKRGRPFGSHGPYKKRSVVSETSVDR